MMRHCITPQMIAFEIIRLSKDRAWPSSFVAEWIHAPDTLYLSLDDYSIRYIQNIIAGPFGAMPKVRAPGAIVSGDGIDVVVNISPYEYDQRVEAWVSRVAEQAYPEAVLLRGMAA